MNNQLKQLYYFSIFFSVSIFLFYTLISEDINSIPIYFNIGTDFTINFNLSFINLLVTIGLIIGIIAIAGIQVFGSGFNDESIRLISKAVLYIILWIILSLFVLSFLEPTGIFGNIFYWCLTICYVLGFIQQITESGVE